MQSQFPPHVYMPRYHLYPDQPQMLHQLVVDLFVRAPVYAKHVADLFAMVPQGPIYKVGPMLAEAWKDILTGVNPERPIILIAGVSSDEDIAAYVTSDHALHAWFGVIALDDNAYVGGVTVDSEKFAEHAVGIEAQLPFIRAYARQDKVVPYIVNMQKSTDAFDDFLDTLFARHGEEAVYVFVQPESQAERMIQRVERR